MCIYTLAYILHFLVYITLLDLNLIHSVDFYHHFTLEQQPFFFCLLLTHCSSSSFPNLQHWLSFEYLLIFSMIVKSICSRLHYDQVFDVYSIMFYYFNLFLSASYMITRKTNFAVPFKNHS